MKETQEELFTSAKLAEKFGVSVGKIKKCITELGIEPSKVKGVCNYYSGDSVKKIEKAVK